MCDFTSSAAIYSHFGVLMVYLCKFQAKTDCAVRHVFPANEYMPWCTFSTASRPPECSDQPSEDGASPLRLPCEQH